MGNDFTFEDLDRAVQEQMKKSSPTAAVTTLVDDLRATPAPVVDDTPLVDPPTSTDTTEDSIPVTVSKPESLPEPDNHEAVIPTVSDEEEAAAPTENSSMSAIDEMNEDVEEEAKELEAEPVPDEAIAASDESYETDARESVSESVDMDTPVEQEAVAVSEEDMQADQPDEATPQPTPETPEVPETPETPAVEAESADEAPEAHEDAPSQEEQQPVTPEEPEEVEEPEKSEEPEEPEELEMSEAPQTETFSPPTAVPTPAPVVAISPNHSPALPTKRRGRFMDVVMPSSDMTTKNTSLAIAPEKLPAPTKDDVAHSPETATDAELLAEVTPLEKEDETAHSNGSTKNESSVTPEEKPALSSAFVSTTVPEKTAVETTTPFLTDASVEKRPLGAFTAATSDVSEATSADAAAEALPTATEQDEIDAEASQVIAGVAAPTKDEPHAKKDDIAKAALAKQPLFNAGEVNVKEPSAFGTASTHHAALYVIIALLMIAIGCVVGYIIFMGRF